MAGLAGSQINVEMRPAIADERKNGRHHIAFFRAILLGIAQTRKQQTNIVPLDSFIIPCNLGGRSASNRYLGVPRIDAPDDYRAVLAWLATKSGKPNIQRDNQNEAERILLWAILEQDKAMSDLTVEDFASYRDWLFMISRTEPNSAECLSLPSLMLQHDNPATRKWPLIPVRFRVP